MHVSVTRLIVLVIPLALAFASEALARQTLTISGFGNNPREEGQATSTPIATARFAVVALQSTKCTASSWAGSYAAGRVSVTIGTSVLNPNQRRFDFDRNLIDGRPAFGHDGFGSPEHVRNNFANTRYVSDLQLNVAARRIVIAPSEFVFLLDPSLLDRTCTVEAFWAPKERVLFVSIRGSEGAGAYHVFHVFSSRRYLGRYAQDVPGEPFAATFASPFLPNVKKAMYFLIHVES